MTTIEAISAEIRDNLASRAEADEKIAAGRAMLGAIGAYQVEQENLAADAKEAEKAKREEEKAAKQKELDDANLE